MTGKYHTYSQRQSCTQTHRRTNPGDEVTGKGNIYVLGSIYNDARDICNMCRRKITSYSNLYNPNPQQHIPRCPCSELED